MILLDANLLIYAVNRDAADHMKAKRWVEETFSGQRGPVLLSWFTLVAFVRISTNARALTNPFSLDEALRVIGEWLVLPGVSVILPAPVMRRSLRPPAGLLLLRQSNRWHSAS